MSRPPKPPDAVVDFELSANTLAGSRKRVFSGYRPIYEILPNYWTSVHHEFCMVESVGSGGKAQADVWFLSPEAYPRSLWIGRKLIVAEGSWHVGEATVVQVLNPLLLSDGA